MKEDTKREELSGGKVLERRLNSRGKLEWCLISPLGLFMGWLGYWKPSLKRIEKFEADSWNR